MLFKQVQKHADNFSYVIADEVAGEAAVVDPSFNAGELIRFLGKANLALKYILNTHGHSDHTAGNAELRSVFPGAKIVAHKLSRVSADQLVDDGDILYVGKIPVKVIHTPGHTPDSICLLVDGKLLTGDTLFVGECGRTDLPGGNARSMYDSLFNKLLQLGDDVEVYPGHDYGVRPFSTIGEERQSNYTLRPRSLEEFVEFMRTP